MEQFTVGNLLSVVSCIALVWIAISLNAMLKKLSHLGIESKVSDATTGATGGTPPKVGGPHGQGS